MWAISHVSTCRFDVCRQIDTGDIADWNQGNSGGPMFDMRGNVIGINSQILSPSGGNVGIGFAIPVDTVRRVVNQLIRYGKTVRPTLGVNVFDDAVATSHPTIAKASPTVCQLNAGDALFLPKGWHHAVISAAEGRRNVAVNTWYDLKGSTTPVARASSLEELFQPEGCR